MANLWHSTHEKTAVLSSTTCNPVNTISACFFRPQWRWKWTTGSWSPRRDPEEVYYFPKEIEVRANWDLNESWDVTALRLDKQKPDALVKQRSDKQKIDTHQRNIERLRQRGE